MPFSSILCAPLFRSPSLRLPMSGSNCMQQHCQDHSRKRRGGGPEDGVWDATQTVVAPRRPNTSSETVWEEQETGIWSHAEIHVTLSQRRREADPDSIRLGRK